MSGPWSQRRVLVAGGAGYIGSHAVRALRALGVDVVVFDSLVTGHGQALPPDVPLVQGDVRDAAAVARALQLGPFDAAMHFAARALVGESVQKPDLYWDVNVEGTRTLARGLSDAGTRAVVFSSTAAVYGDQGSAPLHEGLERRPTNPYGESKAAAEDVLRRTQGLEVAALRYFNAAGAHPAGDLGEDHHPETHLVPLAVAAALGRRPALTLFGADWPTRDGTCVRDYIHVADLIDAHLAALDRLLTGGGGGVWNLGTETGSTVREVLEAVGRAAGTPVPVMPGARRAGDPAALVASAKKAADELGWTARRDLDAIVQDAVRWHRGHPTGYGER